MDSSDNKNIDLFPNGHGITTLENKYKFIRLLPPIAFMLAMIWTLPYPVYSPYAGLDNSWQIALNVAVLDNLQFGKDIAFTYGPLGFLATPMLIDYNLWRISFLFQILMHLLLYLSIYYLLKNLSAKWYHYLLLIPVMLFSNTYMDEQMPVVISAIIFGFLIKDKIKWHDIALLTLSGILVGTGSLIKYNSLFTGYSIVLASLPIFLYLKKDLRYWLCLLISSISSTMSLWMLSGQDIGNFIDFVRFGIDLTSGYTTAMSVSGPNYQVWLALAVIASLMVIFFYSIISKNVRSVSFLILNAFFLFSAYKHGLVRHDSHYIIFLDIFLVICGILFIIILNEPRKGNVPLKQLFVAFNAVIVIILLYFVIATSPLALESGIIFKSIEYTKAINFFPNDNAFDNFVQDRMYKVQKTYPIDNDTLSYIGNRTIDVFPWDVALCWAYDLNWDPRLIFQSYTDYTPYMDNKTSMHFKGSDAPQTIFYSDRSIDDRMQIFDEPSTFKAVLNNYTYATSSGDFILLNYTGENKYGREVDLGKTEVPMGQEILVPEFDGLVFGVISVDYSLYGKIINILYKPSQLYIQYKFKDGTISQPYRFIPTTASNGILLSQYVGDTYDLSLIFQGYLYNDVEGIYIYPDNVGEYGDEIKINFYGVIAPSNCSFIKYKFTENSPIDGTIKYVMLNNSMYRDVISEIPPDTTDKTITYSNISISGNDHLKFSTALDERTWFPDKGDGVLFKIFINDGQSDEMVFSRYIDPKNNKSDRKWKDYDVNLSKWANKNVSIVFITSAGPAGNSIYDWAYWGDPMIYSRVT